jgi:nicotinic acid mononucleotide adenylyltransferase
MPFVAQPDLKQLVAAVDPDGPADVRWPRPLADGARGRRVALLPGSFNPPTSAHLALAREAEASGQVDAAVYVLSKRTVDKEHVTGLALDERLALLCALAEQSGDGVAFVNRGLYVDLAAAFRASLPEARELVFLVGFDKIVQIFDPKYYTDRDAALRELFALASFLVAPRAEAAADELRELLAQPENRQFADRVRQLAIDARYRDVSSTRARRGEEHELPPLVERYVKERRPFD